MEQENKQKEIWKEEARQLKADLASRPRETKKNKVEIKFGGVLNKNTQTQNKKQLPKTTKEDDQAMRRFLGI